jgi:N-acetylglucosaminyldiphosphoundecaprenol N-acetyl-beta-D-mannosaminyltransferase
MNLRNLIRELSPKFIDIYDINFYSKSGGVVLNLNLYGIYLLITNIEFEKSLRNSDYIHIDGVGAAVLVKIITGKYFKPVGYRQWGHRLLLCANSLGLVFIGGTARENLCAKKRVSEEYDSGSIEGVNGYMPKEEYFELIGSTPNKIIIVGLGMPKQELIITILSKRYADKWFFACGGWIKQLAGLESETPEWVSKLKLEWLHRSIGRKNHFNQRVMKPLICILKNF